MFSEMSDLNDSVVAASAVAAAAVAAAAVAAAAAAAPPSNIYNSQAWLKIR